MKLIKSVVPEIIFFSGAVIVFFSLWSITSIAYAMCFLGGFLLIAASMIHGVMTIEEK